MSTRATLIVFLVLFAIAVVLIVVLPLVLGGEPKPPTPEGAERKDQKDEEMLIDQVVFRSQDGGRTWQQLTSIQGDTGSIAAFRINRLAIDPVDPAIFYLATNGHGLWISHSGGELWTAVKDVGGVLRENANVLKVAVNSSDRKEWYAAVFQENRGRLLRTRDAGGSFQEVYFTPVERFGVFDVFYDRATRAVSIATGEGGLLESRDGGDTWRVVRWFADGLLRLLVSPVDSDIRFAASAKGNLFRTTDRGATWTDVTPALQSFAGSRENQHWLIDHSGTLWLGSNYGLLRSRTSATTFEAPPLIIPPEALPVLAVAVDPRAADHVIVAADGQLYESRDDGSTWALLPAPSHQRTTELMFHPRDSRVIYAVVQP